MHRARTILAALVALPVAVLAAPQGAVLHPDVERGLRVAGPSGRTTVVVHLRGQADLGAMRGLARGARRTAVAAALRATSEAAQADLRRHLRDQQALGRVDRFEPLWIANAVAVTATSEAIRALAARPDVAAITPDAIDVVPVGTTAPAEANVAAVGAPTLWSLGFAGQGAVIASLDSGVDVTHPDLASRFRGGAGSWYDPYGQHAAPYDRTGHGTWTTGIAVGGDAGGTSIGVAPQASFIAARIWNDSGSATATGIHKAFQWVLDPDGDPTTGDAPDVVNASWSYGSTGCNLEFQPDLQALRAAGIVPVIAAGNLGPASSSSTSPANYPEALSVGSVDDAGSLATDSSRGPSACGGATFPTVVAPGVNVLTTELFGLYTTVSGTSLAAPHVSGALALLLSSVPSASGAQAEAALVQSARDLGISGPDDDFGHGMIDVGAAYQALASAPPTPPVANGDAYSAVAGTVASVAAPGVLANDSDPSGRPLAAALATGPSHGTLTLAPDGSFTYAPAAGFAGADAFTYRAVAGGQESAPATVAITVLSAAPTASPESYAVAENGVLSVAAPGVLGNDSDPSGRPLTAVLAAAPLHGALVLGANGGFTYTPAAGYYGADSFGYRASNGTSTSDPATVSLTVTFMNQPPVARDDAATTSRGKSVTIAVLANDSDVDGSLVASSVTIVSAPRNGSASRKSTGTVTYAPKRTFRGTDTFTYTVKDDNGATSNVATVTVQVK